MQLCSCSAGTDRLDGSTTAVLRKLQHAQLGIQGSTARMQFWQRPLAEHLDRRSTKSGAEGVGLFYTARQVVIVVAEAHIEPPETAFNLTVSFALAR